MQRVLNYRLTLRGDSGTIGVKKSGLFMKITSRILSIPPYLSTTWKNISSLYVNAEEDRLTLVVRLQNQIQVEVPGLSKELIHEIFEAHSK